MLTSSDIYALINYLSFAQWLSVGGSVAALLYLRYSRPDLNRPIKVDHSYLVPVHQPVLLQSYEVFYTQ